MENPVKKLTLLGLFTLAGIVFSSCSSEDGPEDHIKLWYTSPAKVIENENFSHQREWLKALPLGNGSLGAMVFGDVNLERIQLNEQTMWSGSPTDNDNPEAPKALDKIRNLLYQGKYLEATQLTNETQICLGVGSRRGGPFGSFQTLGELWFDFGTDAEFHNYQRELDLEDAVVRVKYAQDGVNYSREIFASYPDQVLVARFSADQPGSISFSCKMDRLERFTTHTEDQQLIMKGALSDGKGGDGLEYMARLAALNTNGTVSYTDSTVIVKDADEVTMILSASTDYVLSYPTYKGTDYECVTDTHLKAALKVPYEQLFQRHLEEYKSYFDRVQFRLGETRIDDIATDKRIARAKQLRGDSRLVELIFQYGRYLLIASSRPGTMPANLQGLWADQVHSPWNGDYHTDVNIQMNYWPAGVTNLSELQLPMFNLINSLVKPGERTAKIQYDHSGWVVHPIANVWGFTSPGEKASWGMHLGAGAWLCTHIWEHYLYTGDKEFLAQMYPVMWGSVMFYLDWLVEHPQTGKLVSGPAVSPENTFVAPDGSHSQISMGPAHDQQVIWQLFTDFVSTSTELNKMDELVRKVLDARERLAGPEIGSDGRIMEWAEEFPEVEPGHRHISHLFALHPGSQINMEETPELAAAAKKSLEFRIQNGVGDTQAGTFGWSAAWLISQYARLQEPEKASESLNTILSGSVEPNLFNLHPPFQIDGNFGTTAGIAEMLIQSHTGVIQLLPALPIEWSSGEVKGLKARGGFEVDIYWENNRLIRALIKSNRAGSVVVRYLGKEVKFEFNGRGTKALRLSDFKLG
ncbi:MAG: glycoside hydrolase family 95 protein [Lunatimonas sp.]|uniref:glycoside hydrolase family 95 protein n=1 Tax=Lunatimonas sp. TaxID=2060141 RepID=UPI00263AA060|nr:glycoside hydrolase family 95 protein [Lunatimonas sp.]MCC5937139.1 glycoside hydrolase family 95 protein [Lunatimonas sp.]